MKNKLKKIVLFGSTGTLGKELTKFYDFITPSHSEVDISHFSELKGYLESVRPLIVLNSAALAGVKECEENKKLAYTTNVLGTHNLAKICMENKIKLIHISTDSLFDGKKGNYSEEDIPNPINYYSLTKLLGESSVKMLESYLIIRTRFFPDDFKYKKAFTDRYTCMIPVNELAKEIVWALEKDLEGVLNIAGKKDTIYNIIKKIKPQVGKTNMEETSLNLPRDLSLNMTKWKKIKNEFK